VRFQDRTGVRNEIEADGDLSGLLQHEIDHPDGVLAVDRMTDIRTVCTRDEFLRRHRTESPHA
jgi:peptide deformylase